MDESTKIHLTVMEQGARDILSLAGIVDASLARRVSEYLARSADRVRSSGVLTPIAQRDIQSDEPGHVEYLELLEAVKVPREVWYVAPMRVWYAHHALESAVRLARVPCLPESSGNDMVRGIAAATR